MMAKTGNRLTLTFLLGILPAFLLLPAAAQQEAPTILIARLKGTVEIAHAEETARLWEPAVAGGQIGTGWRLRTGADSKAQLVFPRDNIVILKENSVLYVDKLDSGGGAQLEASEGSLLVDLANALAPGSDFELETPTALAVVRGTMYGVDEIGDFNVTFYGYRGAVDVYDSGELFAPVRLTAGYAVDVALGEAPSEPYVPLAADEFLRDAADPEDFAEAELALVPVVAKLQYLKEQLNRLNDTLASYEAEWSRYERNDQAGQLVYLYAQVLRLQEAVDNAAGDYAHIIDNSGEPPETIALLLEELAGALPPPSAGLAERGDSFTGQAELADEFFDGMPGPYAIGGVLGEVTLRFADLYYRLDDLASDAEPYIDDAQDLLDKLGGAIDSGDPALGTRWNVFDTDNDGISDVDELVLGTDPFVNNEDTGFIELIAPDNGDEVDYPDEETVSFEFEPLDSDAVLSYDLLVQAAGRQWLRRDVSEAEDVQLSALVGGNGAFGDPIGNADAITLSWMIVARLDQSMFADRITAANQVMAGGPNVTSEQRELTVNLPAPTDATIIELQPSGTTSVAPEERVNVLGVIENATDLGSWEITITYDSSVLEFDTGRRMGLFGNTTLFFGDHMGGVLTVSGSVPRGADMGISGDGDIFELEFLALTTGSSTIEISDATLTDFIDREIEVEIGDSVDIDVY